MRVIGDCSVSGCDFVCVHVSRAFWPYETLLLPKRHVLRLTDLTESEKTGEIVYNAPQVCAFTTTICRPSCHHEATPH